MATAKIERIIATLKTSSPMRAVGGGVYASFSIVDGIGIKTYRTADARDQHYREQKRLAAAGLAPYVEGCVDYTDSEGSPKFAYLSGIADSVAMDLYGCLWPEGYRGAESVRAKISADLATLNAGLRSVGYSWSDDHNGNWGYINGRPVLIDCSGY